MAEESVEFGNNMENLLSPFGYTMEVPLPKTTPEVPGGMYLSGFISQDCNWGCCYNHSVLKCFPVDKFFDDTHASLNALSASGSVAVSTSSYIFTGGHITCATELAIHNPRTQSGVRKLLLGLSFTGDANNKESRGAVVIFDPIHCIPMKWIEIPEPVSTITVLSHFEEGGSNRPFFNETMMAMVGIAAVGLRGGSVIIIDLGLDDPNLLVASVADSRNVLDSPYRLLYVNPHEYVIATKRHKAVSKRSLIALKFSNEPEDEMIADYFHYCKPSGESVVVLNKNSVAVTCLEYVPSIGSLLVGFTCGGFQIWNVANMELQFSSEPFYMMRDEPLHVFGFSFQQPVDDPKNYCYIWVMYGNKSAECANVHIELHSLYYERKNYVDNFGHVYEGFKQCAKRIAIPLGDEYANSNNDAEEIDNIRYSARPIRIWTQPDSELMYCAWEVGRGGIFYLGTFDLNQWYSNHTKEQLYYTAENMLCPYWVALPVEIPDVSNFVMDIRLLPKSLMRWENPHIKFDVHLYPASLSFRAMLLSNTGVSGFEHFGVQEKLIRKILRDGTSLMIEPENIKRSFIRYGMEPVYPVVFGDELSAKDQDRFFILTVLLESRRTTPIIYLANAWLDGSYANVGCTVDLMIDWIAIYTKALRSCADEHWDVLFHFPDSTLPPESVSFINFSNHVWTTLHRLLVTVMRPSEVYTVRRQELESMEFILGKLVQYSSALLMMYKSQLLPVCDGSFIKRLSHYYDQRRQDAKEALTNCVYIDNELKKSHPLMIDHLMDSLLEDVDLHKEWHVGEDQFCYPPRHVGYLVNMFMLLDTDPKAVSRVFMYFLIDLTLCNQNVDATHDSSFIERKVRGDFKSVMEGCTEEYTEIMALWLLDHGIPNEILVLLKENERMYQKDGLPWCAAAVALTAAGYENDVAELLLKSCPHNLAKLLFSLTTSSISKYTSLAELMISSNLSSNEGLLQEFFEISEAHDRLGEFIRGKAKELPEKVRKALLSFLNNTNSVKRLSQLLMYYVHIEDFKRLREEFTRVREILRHRTLSEIDRKMWRFQETYVNHLLNTTKGNLVKKFLLLQNPETVRPTQNTISIKAIQASEDDIELEVTSDRGRMEPKLPPHLRRLKLNETVVQDPLSPLRRYAGRIQSVVSASSTNPETIQKSDESQKQKQLSSRKSFIARRASLSVSRHSILNNTRAIYNDSFVEEDKLNITHRTSQIDLVSLLKTPSVDHRAENRQRCSFSLNMTMNRGLNETVVNNVDPPLPHSIMKETDSSKPKMTKKMEIRFQDLSISSEEGDEKNTTIYEDADQTVNEENEQGNADIEASFNSAVDDQSMFRDASEEEILLDDIQSTPTKPPESGENICSSQTVPHADPVTVSTEDREGHSQIRDADNVVPQSEDSPDPLESESLVAAENASSLDKTQEEGEPRKVRRESGKGTKRSRSSTPAEDSSLYAMEKSDSETTRKTRKTRSDTPTRSDVEMAPIPETKEGISIEEVAPSTRRSSRRSSRSRTPTRDLDVASTEEVAAAPSARSRRSTRSRTPTRDLEVIASVSSDDVSKSTKPSQTQTGEIVQTASLTDPVTVSTEEAEGHSHVTDAEHSVPLCEISPGILESESLGAPENDSIDKTSTPTKDSSHHDVENSASESETTPTKRKTRRTRSKTPTRGDVEMAPIPEANENISVEEVAPPTRLSSRRSTRSRTPTRDLEVASVQEVSAAPSVRLSSRRSTRSRTPTRDSELASIEEVVPSTRLSSKTSTRSRTPTRDLEAASDDISKPTTRRSGLRPSKTPYLMDIISTDPDLPTTSGSNEKKKSLSSSNDATMLEVDEVEEAVPSTRLSSRRSTRSHTPTRDLELASVTSDDVSKPTRRRGSSRASKTPVRDLIYADEPDPLPAPGSNEKRKSLSSSDAPLEVDEAATSIEEVVPSTRRSSRRSTRSRTPTRDLDVASVSSDDVSKPATRRVTRASKTPIRELYADVPDPLPAPGSSKKRKSVSSDAPLETSQSQPSTSASSFLFEITQEDMEEEETEEVESPPTITSKKDGKVKISQARKRRLKYLQHQQDLSTVIEDSGNEEGSEASVFEATLMPVAKPPEPPKNRKIKGIKARPSEEIEPESPPAKPSKRRKASSIIDDFDGDDDLDTQSHASSHNTRSESARKKTGSSSKPKTKARKKTRAASKSKSTA